MPASSAVLARDPTLPFASLREAIARGQHSEVAAHLRECLPGPSATTEQILHWNLVNAFACRQRGDWPRARAYSEAAERSARANGPVEEFAEALFGLATCEVEDGKPFLGMHLLQEALDLRGVSERRRHLCAVNLAWVFWDLGLTDELRALLEGHPEMKNQRWALHLALRDAQLDEVLRLEQRWIEVSGLASPELDLSHWIYPLVMGRVVLQLPGPVPAELLAGVRGFACCAPGPAQRQLGAALEKLLAPSAPLAEASATTLPWRDTVELRFLEALSLRNIDAYAREVHPLLVRHHLRTPLIPRYQDGAFESVSPWTRALERHFGLALERAPTLHVDLETSEVWSSESACRLSLKSRHSLLQLLVAVAGPARTNVDKADAFRHWMGREATQLADDERLRKALSRLHQALVAQGLPRPLEPRDKSTWRRLVHIVLTNRESVS
jgi:hypothetical protein